MAAVRAGVGRETAHEVIKEHAVAVALAMREKGQADNDLVARLPGRRAAGPGAGCPRRPARRPAVVHRSGDGAGRGGRRPGRRDHRRTPRGRRLHPGSDPVKLPALGQGARRLRGRRTTSARRVRPRLDLRRGAADPDPGQGRGAHPAVAVVVRPARRPRAEPRDLGRRRPAGVRRAGDALPAPGDAAGGVRRARLPHRGRPDGLREDRRRVRRDAAARARRRCAAARADLHAVDEGSTRSARRGHDLRAGRGPGGGADRRPAART